MPGRDLVRQQFEAAGAELGEQLIRPAIEIVGAQAMMGSVLKSGDLWGNQSGIQDA